MNTKKTKPSDQKGKRHSISKSKRFKKPLTQILLEERKAERIQEDRRKRLV
jgi:hypothetical protein